MKKLVMLAFALVVCAAIFAQSVTFRETNYEEAGYIFRSNPSKDDIRFAKENKLKVRVYNIHFTGMTGFQFGDPIMNGKKFVVFADEALEFVCELAETQDDFWCWGTVFLFQKSDNVALGECSNNEWIDDGYCAWVDELTEGKFKAEGYVKTVESF